MNMHACPCEAAVCSLEAPVLQIQLRCLRTCSFPSPSSYALHPSFSFSLLLHFCFNLFSFVWFAAQIFLNGWSFEEAFGPTNSSSSVYDGLRRGSLQLPLPNCKLHEFLLCGRSEVVHPCRRSGRLLQFSVFVQRFSCCVFVAGNHAFPPRPGGDADFWGVIIFRQYPYIWARNQLLCMTFPPKIPAAKPRRRSCFHIIFDFSGRLSSSPSESSESGPDPGQDRRSGVWYLL